VTAPPLPPFADVPEKPAVPAVAPEPPAESPATAPPPPFAETPAPEPAVEPPLGPGTAISLVHAVDSEKADAIAAAR
jgi:hypothetical protein